jgi:hypothetical protein
MRVVATRNFFGGRSKGTTLKMYEEGKTYDISEEDYKKIPGGSFKKVDAAKEAAK